MAVLRLSGVELRSFARRIAGIDPLPRHAHLVAFRDATDTPVDQGLLLWFPGPHSYTGEDVLELHTHGGDILPQSVLRACVAAGAQLAGPGDFTRRAFENGKLDLIQAEAVADLIDASSEAAARGALRSLSGAFSAQVSALQASLTSLRVQLEGGIDFPEESLSLAGSVIIRGGWGRGGIMLPGSSSRGPAAPASPRSLRLPNRLHPPGCRFPALTHASLPYCGGLRRRRSI